MLPEDVDEFVLAWHRWHGLTPGADQAVCCGAVSRRPGSASPTRSQPSATLDSDAAAGTRGQLMVEFSVRIDFYRDPKGPTDYVGSALRDGFTAVVLPRVGEYVSGITDSHPWYGPDGETGGPYAEVLAVEHSPTPAWRIDPDKPQEEREPGVR